MILGVLAVQSNNLDHDSLHFNNFPGFISFYLLPVLTYNSM